MATEKEINALVGRVRQLEGAIKWALGENGVFPARGEDEGPYYWRQQLRSMMRIEPMIFDQQLIIETSLQKRLANAVNMHLQAKIKVRQDISRKRKNWIGEIFERSSDFSDTRYKRVFVYDKYVSAAEARIECEKERRNRIYCTIMNHLTIDWAFSASEDV